MSDRELVARALAGPGAQILPAELRQADRVLAALSAEGRLRAEATGDNAARAAEIAHKWYEKDCNHFLEGDEVNALAAAIAAALDEAEARGRAFKPKLGKAEIAYVSQYGPRCRDCADRDGICSTGMPCDDDKAIRFVIGALNYGWEHGFLDTPSPAAQPAKGEI